MNDSAEIILAAVLQARADGDEASARALEALLGRPDEAGRLVRQVANDHAAPAE